MRIDGLRLKRLRELRGLNQSGLSATSGVSNTYICSIERGNRNDVSGPIAKKLADALGIEIADLAATSDVSA